MRESSDTIRFHIDDFPHDWRKGRTSKPHNLWDLEPEDRLKFIFSVIYKRLRKELAVLEGREVEHHTNGALRTKYLGMRKGRSYGNYSVIATTVHGALIHKRALSEVRIVQLLLKLLLFKRS